MVSFSQFQWGGSTLMFPGVPGGPPPQQAPYQVYCSSSLGNDANDGMSPATAKATYAAAYALMRSGIEDHLLMKWGDTWTEVPPVWTTSGRSMIRPQKLGTYGSQLTGARPKIQTGTSSGIVTSGAVSYVTFENVWLTAQTYNATVGAPIGINVADTAAYITVQGCKLSNLVGGVKVEPNVAALHSAQHITIYRNNVEDIYAAAGTACHGVYVSRTNFANIDDNVLSKIGEVDPGVEHYGILIRSGYTYWCYDVTTSGNLFIEVAGKGLCNRSTRYHGEYNTYVRCGIAVEMDGLDPVNGNAQEGVVDSSERSATILEPRDTNGSNARGWGFAFSHCGSPFESNSVIAPEALYVGTGGTSTDPHPFVVWPTYPPAAGLQMRHVAMQNWRVYEPGGQCKINEHPTNDPFRTNTFDGSRIYSTGVHYVIEHNLDNGSRWNMGSNHLLSGSASGSRYRYNGVSENQATWKAHLGFATGTDENVSAADFPDATRTIATYDTVVGGAGTFADFVALVRTQTLQSWRPELGGRAVGSWIRVGHGFST